MLFVLMIEDLIKRAHIDGLPAFVADVEVFGFILDPTSCEATPADVLQLLAQFWR
jgi:hypothetical protein